MRDAIVSLPRIMQLHPAVRAEVIATIEKVENGFPANVRVRVTDSLRTEDEQNNLYALGRTKKNPDGYSVKKPLGNIVTNAKFGQSYHNFGLAIDFCLLYDLDNNGTFETASWDTLKDYDRDGVADWQEVVKLFKTLGWTWGGDFKSLPDSPHLEKSFGLGYKDLLARYNAGSFIAQPKYVTV